MKGHFINCPDPTDCWCEVRRLSRVLWITLAILIFEIIGAIVSNSLALFADAGHVFGDSTAIVVTLLAAVLVRFGAQAKRVRNVAFWINIGLLFLIVIWIVFEAIKRFENPNEIISSVMIVVAFIGGVGNYWQHHVLEGAASEHKHHAHRALSFHVISDLIQSVVVVIGGILIWISGWILIDPLLSIGIACWIVYRTFQLVFNSYDETDNT
ncbi:cation transporter [Patescibacteria group bacterium]|nr:cation transporter [Patescibacteria group bacterium]